MSVHEVRDNDDGPTCHVCGAVMTETEDCWKCLACGAEPSQSDRKE